MPDRRPRISSAELALLAALSAWAAYPLVLLLIHAAADHATFSGADGLIGAGGVLGSDQLQYMAWARDAGAHGLISDLFTLGQGGHVYLQPMFFLSGLLNQLGVALAVAYLLWKPVAVLALFGAALAWSRRMVDGTAVRAATVALALFMCAPVVTLFSWAKLGQPPFRFQAYLVGDELLAADKLWGYLPSALGMALVPVAILAAERAIEPYALVRAEHRQHRGTQLGSLAVAGLAAGTAGWLHPWQGITLIVIFAGLAVWRRLRGGVALGALVACAAAPLAYYYLLGQDDAAWRLASANNTFPHLPALALVAGLGPVALLAALGVRRPGEAIAERALLLWLVGCLVAYFGNDTFPPHAFAGLSFPLAVLVVRGGQRWRVPAVVGALVVALFTLPAVAYYVKFYIDDSQRHTPALYVPKPDAVALDSLRYAPPGGALAPVPFAALIPEWTGRAVWAGHGFWTPDYVTRARAVNRLFNAHMRPALARAFVRSTGATVLVADCAHTRSLRGELGPLIASEAHFGCATVYLVGRSARR